MVPLLIKRESWHHIATSQMICSENQLTGFYVVATLALNELMWIKNTPQVLVNHPLLL